VSRLLRRLEREGGYSLVETITVLAILGGVMGSLTGLFVAGTKSEVDLNKRFEAQLNARLALTKLRREVHCASSATATATSVTLTLESFCRTGNGQVTWCVVSISGGRHGLFRKTGATCDATGVKWADHLVALTTPFAFFSYTPQTTDSLAKLELDVPVDIDLDDPSPAYRLEDAFVLRNSTRETP
jgi:type II secretory pathway pseudopilin PulG